MLTSLVHIFHWILILSVFFLPVTSGYLSLHCGLRQQSGMICCESPQTLCCPSEAADILAYRTTDGCPCQESLRFHPEYSPDIDRFSAKPSLPSFSLLSALIQNTIMEGVDYSLRRLDFEFHSPPVCLDEAIYFLHQLRL